ncbi:MAG: 30S ribosomal protein S6 [Chloroflexi bacterium]|jgi:small subunit ribosomal protein S6|nr:30S ribosomal protein S6 [Chloroflexota bacterium]MBT3669894.1 30S ribosomal protein S6 [Chloroflexota bacterium]MBT4001967.1 30S ribosomal protein S6 [Chloroflexota bacterium]MBT4304796.1 30S ribosomal protein S6 [Chloroflexota bacterium]MBT4534703.1 30S ribosomal protein S6 [Chloroflexota bacterium]
MRSYEVVVIVHPDLDEKAFTEVLDRVQGWITEADGKVTKVDLWGKKKLAYEIRKQTEGQYVIIYADMNPTFCSELERNLQLNESIMRFMVTIAIEVEDEPEVIETEAVEVEAVETETVETETVETETVETETVETEALETEAVEVVEEKEEE